MSSPSGEISKTENEPANKGVTEGGSEGSESGTVVGDVKGNGAPLASISEVFSFAETPRTKAYIALGILFSIISGLAMPASLLYFSSVLSEISAIGTNGLDPVIKIVYTMLVLGVISLICETLQCK
eukprot:scaffold26232_cov152-Cylindrotheca_fusiformis.AAC.2